MPKTPKSKPSGNGRKHVARPYAERAQEYQDLLARLGLNQTETGKLFEYAGRTSRRYKRGDGKVPLSALIVLRLMAQGVVTKRQVLRASELAA